jgi:Domain of unknown function (DUF5655)/Domain of unknown function (DUF4287)
MSTLEQALETQLKNIQSKTGKTFEELRAIVQQSGLTKHGELRAMLQRELGLGYGDANSLVHAILQSDGTRAAQASGATDEDVISEIYSGTKAGLRPIHEQFMVALGDFGPFEIVPKKGYISLRRKKQFAMIGPVTNARVEVGLNMKGVEATERLTAMPAGGMCNYKVKVTDAQEVDDELMAWTRQAYVAAG